MSLGEINTAQERRRRTCSCNVDLPSRNNLTISKSCRVSTPRWQPADVEVHQRGGVPPAIDTTPVPTGGHRQRRTCLAQLKDLSPQNPRRWSPWGMAWRGVGRCREKMGAGMRSHRERITASVRRRHQRASPSVRRHQERAGRVMRQA